MRFSCPLLSRNYLVRHMVVAIGRVAIQSPRNVAWLPVPVCRWKRQIAIYGRAWSVLVANGDFGHWSTPNGLYPSRHSPHCNHCASHAQLYDKLYAFWRRHSLVPQHIRRVLAKRKSRQNRPVQYNGANDILSVCSDFLNQVSKISKSALNR